MWSFYTVARRLSRRYYPGDIIQEINSLTRLTILIFPRGVGHFLSFARKFCPILWGICLFWYGIQSQSQPISRGGWGVGVYFDWCIISWRKQWRGKSASSCNKVVIMLSFQVKHKFEKRQAIVERLRQRIDIFRKRHDSCQARLEETQG
jgi:hypothetical protein